MPTQCGLERLQVWNFSFRHVPDGWKAEPCHLVIKSFNKYSQTAYCVPGDRGQGDKAKANRRSSPSTNEQRLGRGMRNRSLQSDVLDAETGVGHRDGRWVGGVSGRKQELLSAAQLGLVWKHGHLPWSLQLSGGEWCFRMQATASRGLLSSCRPSFSSWTLVLQSAHKVLCLKGPQLEPVRSGAAPPHPSPLPHRWVGG